MLQQERLESALRERSLMLKEIHHRVKSQHSMCPEAATHLDAISARVHAMGAFHAALYREGQFGEVELRDYAASILQIERALPVGLLVNESLTTESAAPRQTPAGHRNPEGSDSP